jgi:hypothetical protein
MSGLGTPSLWPGALLVTEVQPEGKRRQGALEFVNGLRRDAFTLGT